MCLGGGSARRIHNNIRPQQPLPPPPPPPAPPAPPLPRPEPLVTDVNPSIRRARSKKDKNPLTKGTSALRIKLDRVLNVDPDNVGGNY